MRKVIELDERFPTGEFTVQPAVLVGRNGKPLREQLTKTASEAADYLATVEPRPGHSLVLVLALGAFERYGLNRNADGFNEHPYKVGQRPLCGHDACYDPAGWIGPKDIISQHYQTFEQYGKFYKHHQNNDPAKAVGDVIKAFWNASMHRVELLTAINNKLAPDIAERIADGAFPAVSMGCSPAGASVLMADGSYKVIESVVAGDRIVTHKGREGVVSDTMVRDHAGDIFTLDVAGFDVPLRLTEEHPLWVIRQEALSCIPSKEVANKGRTQRRCSPNSATQLKGCANCTTSFEPKFEWVRTDAVQEGDYMALPVPSFPATQTFTPEEARLLGYYLAEGYTWENNNAKTPSRGVTLCTGIHEVQTHREIYSLAEKLGYEPFENDVPERNGKYIGITSPYLADLCSTHCGDGAKTKRLSAALLGSGAETLRLLLGAYANGDGFTSAGSLFFSTSSYALAHQLQLALAQCDMLSTVQSLNHKPNALVKKATTEYQVRVGKHFAAKLGKATRLQPDDAPAVTSEKRFFYTFEGVRYVMARIASIEKTAFEDKVYNFEVEGDNSYVLEHLAVHNCKIKYDVCTVCGHRAATRKEYCEHMKFKARQIHSSGVHIGVLNPSPRWFDISYVIKPADQTGYMLKKVAEEGPYVVKSSAAMGEYLDAVQEKQSALRKIADIDKIVRGVAIDHKTSPLSEQEAGAIKQYRNAVLPAVASMPTMDDATLKSLSKHSLPEILSTLASVGVILTTPECVKIIVEQMAPGTVVPEDVLTKMVAVQSEIFSLFAEQPQLLEQLIGGGQLDVSKARVNPAVGEKAERYLEKRSTISDYLSRALVPRFLRKEEAPNTDPLTLTDPSTGMQYATNRGAAIKMHDSIARGQLTKMLGGAALLAGGAKIVSTGLPKAMHPLAWGSAALLGHSLLKPDYGPHYMTDQGVSIPAGTELMKQGNELASVALPLVGTAGLVAALGHDYEARRAAGYPVGDPAASLPQKAYAAVGQYTHEHPASSALIGLSLYGLGRGKFFKKAADAVTLPELDVEALAEKIGCLFFE